MPVDKEFDAVDRKLQESSETLRRMQTVFLRPEHTGQYDPYRIVQMSCPNTIVHYEWYGRFKTFLHDFLAGTRSIPDIIETRFGWDDHAREPLRDWFNGLDVEEKTRRRRFRDEFRADFTAFNRHELSEQRRKSIHFDGQVDWHVEVKGFGGKTYFGDNENPLPQAEEMTFTGDPRLDVPVMSSQAVHLQARAKDFWLGQKGDPDRTSLFEECRDYLTEAENLVQKARSLFNTIHDGHSLTRPTWR